MRNSSLPITVAAVNRGHAELFALELLHVFDDIWSHHQVVNALLEQDEGDSLHRQPLDDAAKGADERSRESHVAVQNRRAPSRGLTWMNSTSNPSSLKKFLRLGDVVSRVGIAPARQRNTISVCARILSGVPTNATATSAAPSIAVLRFSMDPSSFPTQLFPQ
jgi:hypothetical protein